MSRIKLLPGEQGKADIQWPRMPHRSPVWETGVLTCTRARHTQALLSCTPGSAKYA